MRFVAMAVAALFAASLLAGCGGAGTAPSIPPGTPVVQGHSAMLTLRLDAPASASTSATRSKPKYLSPAMQSLVYVITGPGASTAVVGSGAVNLTPGAPACSSPGALQPFTCTAQVPVTLASTGSYTFNVATYDAVQAACTGTLGVCGTAPCTPGATGAQACSGKVLSDQDIAQTLTLGTANAVTLALGGVATSIAVSPLAAGYLQGDVHGLKLWGPGAQRLSVEARDADGNVIVGPGSPAVAVTASSAELGVTAAGAGAPNTFTLQAATSGSPAVVTPGTVDLTVALTAPASGGGSVPANTVIPVTIAHSIVYVSLHPGGGVEAFEDGNTSASYTIPIFMPQGLAVDASGTLYAANDASGVDIYPAGSATASMTIVTGYPALGIAIGANGALYVSDLSGNVHVYPAGSATASGTIAFAGPTGFYALTTGLTADPSGNVFEAVSSTIPVLTPTIYEIAAGSSSMNVMTSYSVHPSDFDGVAADSLGTLFLTDGSAVYDLPPGASSATNRNLNGLLLPDALAVDAAGTLYVADYIAQTVVVFPSGSSSPSQTISLGTADPDGIAVVPASFSR